MSKTHFTETIEWKWLIFCVQDTNIDTFPTNLSNHSVATVYRLPEGSGSLRTRGEVHSRQWWQGIQLLRAILHFGAPALLYSIPPEAIYVMEKLLELFGAIRGPRPSADGLATINKSKNYLTN